jgi:hypothetical protein
MTKKNTSALKDIRLHWWQAGLFKTAAVSFGILLALYFGEYLKYYTGLFWITFLVPGIYILYIYFKK